MSHHSTYAVLPPMHPDSIGAALAERMAPYSEDRRVDPYREPEAATPDKHWFYEALAAKNLFGRSIPSRETTGSDKAPPRAGVGWAEYVEVFNTDMGHDSTVTNDGVTYVNRDFLFYDADQDCAYTMSESNPDAKWDFWKLGSASKYRPFHVYRPWTLPVAPRGKEISLPGDTDTFTVDRDGRTDGARRAYIDFDAMSEAADKHATEEWHVFRSWQPADADPPRLPETIHAELDPALSENKKHSLTWRKAWEQPVLERMQRVSALDWRMSDPESVILANLLPLETYLVRAREAAVVPYQILTHDQRWITEDDHGRFESHHTRYRQETAAYLRDLPGDHWLIALDTHI